MLKVDVTHIPESKEIWMNEWMNLLLKYIMQKKHFYLINGNNGYQMHLVARKWMIIMISKFDVKTLWSEWQQCCKLFIGLFGSPKRGTILILFGFKFQIWEASFMKVLRIRSGVLNLLCLKPRCHIFSNFWPTLFRRNKKHPPGIKVVTGFLNQWYLYGLLNKGRRYLQFW